MRLNLYLSQNNKMKRTFLLLVISSVLFALIFYGTPQLPVGIDHAKVLNSLNKKTLQRGKEIYQSACFTCHGVNGTASLSQARSFIKDPMRFEVSFLKKMGLKPHLGSTQILPPEDLMNLAQNTFNFCSVVAKLATDLRHLARSEISEISEGMAPGQVGSSTMPQKRNPWNLEHVCSLFKVLTSRVQLMQMDMISEHQRDLTNSASGRFYVETFSLAFLMVNRLTKVLVSLEAHPERMKLHLKEAGSSIFAEALYVMATRNGVTSAHDQIREASREAEKSGKSLLEVALAKSRVEKTVTSETPMQEVLKGLRSKIESIERKWRTG